MPTSQYVYADANETPGPGGTTVRRRSQRIHRKSLAKAQTLQLQHDDDGLADPDETVLGDDDNDETVLLSFEETDENHHNGRGGNDDGLKPHHSTVDAMAMDADERGGRRDEDAGLRRSRFRQQPSMNEEPKLIRGGNGGVLSDDPLTSSTTKSVPFSALRARQAAPASIAQISTTERLRRLAHQLGSDESDDDENSMDMSGRDFIREVVRKRAQHEALLAESQPCTQQSVQVVGFNDSEDTDKIVNRNETSSFDRTEPWEKEIDKLDLRMQRHHQLLSNREEYSLTNSVPQKQSSSANHQYDSQYSQLNSQPNLCNQLPPYQRNYEQVRQGANVHQDQSSSANHQYDSQYSQLNSYSNRSRPNQCNQLPPYQRNNEQVRQVPMSRTTHQEQHGAANLLPNPYLRKEPLPPPQQLAANVRITSVEQMKSTQQVQMSERETWQQEAFRSSLLELLGAFPSHYFNIGDETSTAGNQTHLLATENIDDDSPRSTTSQRTASAQLNRQRLFDAASRSLARLAIASRHGTKRNSSRDKNDGESPDFDPPSPRSLPAYMSVMNVYDDSNNEGSTTTHWGAGNSNGVFSGRSVHGRSARTLHLSRTPQESGGPSSSLFSSWSLEQLTFGSLVLAARVCSEAFCDRGVEQKNRWHSNSVPESCRGCAQSSSIMQGENMARHPVSSALVGSSLGLLATAFACLDSDLVYSVLKVPLTMNECALPVTVFDVISDFAPVPTENPLTEDIYTVSALSLLALSRGFEAVIDVARRSTMDPSSVCAAFTSPHDVCGNDANVTIDTGVDKGGVGWLSALGRDLGLKLEDTRNSRPRHMRLSEIARSSYEFVLSYNPISVNDGSNLSLVSSKHHGDRGDKKRGTSRGELFIDIEDGRGNQGTHSIACRQQSVMTDRVYAANATFLAAMIHAGIVSDWLSNDSNNVDHRDPGESRLMKVNNLCQKLFNVIETAARLRRSVKQSNTLPDPGDGEAVCTSSLSLLLLVLPKHVEQTLPVSLSASFRQMGNSSGSVEDLLHSPLVRNMVELALSWQFSTSSNEYNSMISDNVKSRAATNSMNIISELCMVGGASLICTHFRERLDEFLHNLIRFICERGKIAAPNCHDCSTVGSSLLLFLHLHTGSPIFIRKFLRNFFEDSSSSGDDCAKDFVGGLLHFVTDESYSVSSFASSLLRALIDGNPADRTQDRLCLLLLGAFDAEIVASPVEDALHFLFDGADTSDARNIPFYFSRYYPRKCCLGDLMCVCTHTRIFASSMTDDLLGKFENAIKYDPQQSQYDSLSAAATLALIHILASFANTRNGCDNIGASILVQQSRVKERLRKILLSVVAQLESAMRQGASVDVTHRALQLQNALIQVSDERFLAQCCTNASTVVAIRERILRDKLTSSQVELLDVVKRSQNMQLDYDNLNNAYHDQRQTYERQIEWIRSEHRMAAKHVSEILADERQQAEEQCSKEREAKLRAELKFEQLTRESGTDKSRIKDLEQLLARERKSREDFELELEMCKKELGQTSMELKRISSDNRELEEKLLVSENKVLNLSATRKEVEANLEDTCSKLIMLATVYQRNEVEVEKYKSELRSAMNTANRHADEALAKYENARKQNKFLSKQLEEVTAELNSTKAHRADVQRMRKNAPVAYLNQLHNGSLQGRPNRSGKENVYDER